MYERYTFQKKKSMFNIKLTRIYLVKTLQKSTLKICDNIL